MLDFLKSIWLDTVGLNSAPTRFRFFNWLMLALLIAAVAVIGFCEFVGGIHHYSVNRGWYVLTPGALFFLAFTGPVLRLASDERDRGIRVVIFWGLAGLAVFIITFVMAYHVFFPDAGPGPYDRLINVVPAVVAVWGAGLGWYTHHQITMKGHRTTHAFNLIMQMQTNAEYAKNFRAFISVYPRGKNMPYASKDPAKDAELYYESEWVTKLPALQAQVDDAKTKKETRDAAREKILKIEAALAAKYLLNYFEFMARGIKSWDLDARVLHDTIGVMVVSLYRRTEGYRAYLNPDQRLAGANLGPLAEEWEKQILKKEADVPRSR